MSLMREGSSFFPAPAPKGKLAECYQHRIDMYFSAPVKFYQDLYRSLNILASAEELIGWDTSYHDYLSKEFSDELLRKIFALLAIVVCGNEVNQKALTGGIEKIITFYLKQSNEIGLLPYLFHLFDQNYHLIQDEELTNRIVENLFTKIGDPMTNFTIQSFVLSVLANIVNAGVHSSVQSTQTIVLRRLFENPNPKQKDPFALETDIITEINDEMLDSELVMLNPASSDEGIVVPPRSCFFMAMLQTLSACCEGKNAYSENISQTLFPLTTICQVLSIPNLHVAFKLMVVDFLIPVFVETEKESLFNIREIIINVGPILLNDFESMLRGDFPMPSHIKAQSNLVLTTLWCMRYSELIRTYQTVLAKLFLDILRQNIKISNQSVDYPKYSAFVRALLTSIETTAGSGLSGSSAAQKVRTLNIAIKRTLLEFHGDALVDGLTKKT